MREHNVIDKRSTSNAHADGGKKEMAKNFQSLIDKAQKKKDGLVQKRDEYLASVNEEIKSLQAEIDFYTKKKAEQEKLMAQLAAINDSEFEGAEKPVKKKGETAEAEKEEKKEDFGFFR